MVHHQMFAGGGYGESRIADSMQDNLALFQGGPHATGKDDVGLSFQLPEPDQDGTRVQVMLDQETIEEPESKAVVEPAPAFRVGAAPLLPIPAELVYDRNLLSAREEF